MNNASRFTNRAVQGGWTNDGFNNFTSFPIYTVKAIAPVTIQNSAGGKLKIATGETGTFQQIPGPAISGSNQLLVEVKFPVGMIHIWVIGSVLAAIQKENEFILQHTQEKPTNNYSSANGEDGWGDDGFNNFGECGLIPLFNKSDLAAWHECRRKVMAANSQSTQAKADSTASNTATNAALTAAILAPPPAAASSGLGIGGIIGISLGSAAILGAIIFAVVKRRG